MERTINFVGNEHTNKSTRRGQVPCCIVNHISEGSKESCINWFTSPTNKVSSAHFLVGRDGTIYQFVPIEEMAWANGLSQQQLSLATAAIVAVKGMNPNWYSVSIEHEGVYAETKGALTAEQLESTIWLHKYIINYVKENFSSRIVADRNHILGHYEIDPVRKPHCPGEQFPFDKIISSLTKQLPFSDIYGHWAEDSIVSLHSAGLVNGFPDGTFKPNQTITRAEVAAIVSKLLTK